MSSELLAGRPPATVEESCWLPYSRRAPAHARHLLRTMLSAIEGGEQLVRTAELLLSELVTNAVQHGRRTGRLMWVRLELRGRRLRIEVHDAGLNPPALRPATLGDDSGRGLLLVNSLASAWGWTPRSGGIGKIVWCECEVHDGA